MRNNAFVFAMIASLLSVSACETYPKSLPPGEYSSQQSSTNAAGTKTTKTTDTEVYYDEHGNKRAVQETETTRDPKGLFNKSTTSSSKTYN